MVMIISYKEFSMQDNFYTG